MSRHCFLHVGAAKTGTTSIQEAFFHHLRDPSFQYVSGGWANGSFAFSSVFETPPGNEWAFHALDRPGRFEDYRDRFARRIELGFRRAKARDAHVVISSELTWGASRKALGNIHRRLMKEGLDVRVFAYVRPWHRWADSMFQEAVKAGRSQLLLGRSMERDQLMVRERLENLFAVFGRDSVSVSLFDPRRFPGGCVVRDFCGQIGYPLPSGRTWRTNESLSLEGVKLLFAFNRHGGPMGEWARPKPAGLALLIRRLQRLRGPAFELHCDFLKDWLAEREREDPWIEAQLGFSLSDGPRAPDAEQAVATEADLLRYSESTRDWLARQTGQRPVRLAEGEAAARAIASQVDCLRLKRPSAAEWLERRVGHARYWWVQRITAC